MVAVAAAATVVAAAGVRAEDEAAEEDDGHDEDGACHDADPRGDRSEPARSAPPVLVRLNRWRRSRWLRGWHRAGDGAGCGFGGRGCFAHVPDDGRGSEV
jgi:hypothetical protein